MDIIEKERIRSLVEAVGIMTDERQAENLGYAYMPDAKLLLPYDERFDGRDDVLRGYQAFWDNWKSIHHLLGQCVITSFSGNRAEGILYCLLTCVQMDNRQRQWGLIYKDEYQMINGEWYIHRRCVENIWER